VTPRAALWTLPRQNHGHARARECLSAQLWDIPVSLSHFQDAEILQGLKEQNFRQRYLVVANCSGAPCTINLAEHGCDEPKLSCHRVVLRT